MEDYTFRLETAVAFADSYDANPRNLEHPRYTVWHLFLLQIVLLANPRIHSANEHTLLIHPQFCAWLSPEDSELFAEQDDEIVDDGSGTEDDSEEEGAGDVSFASTIAVPNAPSVIVDFALILLSPSPFTARVLVLIECKRAPKRGLTDKLRRAKAAPILKIAKVQAFKQATYLFSNLSFGKWQTTVFLIATAGEYFSWAKAERPTESMPLNQLIWSPMHCLGDDTMKTELYEMYEYICAETQSRQ
ncbi:hypothetical protein GGX14DRAFT_460807 [Mycena pura]|uniref:Uncharacterized protein n=1 Tax=Mycena pura TaxID=153505 RepID=A0AAD6V6B3_9AGAR|nr:hypothetical protein GGX14DRAFT_460807 [Mycena pura]